MLRDIIESIRHKSNLAFALAPLPKGKRRQMLDFYKFCRRVDDIADEPGLQLCDRIQLLDFWQNAIDSTAKKNPSLNKLKLPKIANAPIWLSTQIKSWPQDARELSQLIQNKNLPLVHLSAIINGARLDVEGEQVIESKGVFYVNQNLDDLHHYCYLVAGAVGLVSARIFTEPCQDSDRYARSLGEALQITNIIRDFGEDFSQRRRVYVPREICREFGVDENTFCSQRQNELRQLFEKMASLADEAYARASASLPQAKITDFKSAELMRAIYQNILNKMRADKFQVFSKRYKPTKLFLLVKALRSIGFL